MNGEVSEAPARGAPFSPARGGAPVRTLTRAVLSAVAGIGHVPVLVLALLMAPVRPAQTVARWVGRRLTWADGLPRRELPEGGRLFGLLATSAALGTLTACVLTLIILGASVSVQMIVAAATSGPVTLFSADPGRVTWTTVAAFTAPGAVLLFLAGSGIAGIAWLERQAWNAFSRPGAGELAQQVTRLHTTLDDVVAAVDAERRRIERDIHDGVQQRVVALSLLLARAERANGSAEATASSESAALLRRARAEAQHLLDELRDVAWRTYPAMLARDGLAVALEALRDRTPVAVRLRVDAELVDRAIETTAYFVASEAVTNAVKHADATLIEIRTRVADGALILTIDDDGVGGADPAGAGLSGIASRVAAQDGRLRVTSPAGGPTTIEAVIPCG